MGKGRGMTASYDFSSDPPPKKKNEKEEKKNEKEEEEWKIWGTRVGRASEILVFVYLKRK